MALPELFHGEDENTRHPDDARHWAQVYANLMRTLPGRLCTSEVEARLRARLEFWEERLRILEAEESELISSYNRNRPAQVRRAPRAAPAAADSESGAAKPVTLTG